MTKEEIIEFIECRIEELEKAQPTMNDIEKTACGYCVEELKRILRNKDN